MVFAKMTIQDYWRQLLLWICEPIYKLIVYLYELFEVVGTAEIITNETLTVLYNRIGLLLGLYMLFRILFSFIQMLINPDYISDKEKGIGKITSKALLTIVLIAITPYIFEKAIELQNFIVGVNGDRNVIANIILPDQNTSKFDDFGPKLSAYLFESFYRYDDEASENERKYCDILEEYSPGVTKLHESIVRSKGSVSFAEHCLVGENFKFKNSINGEKNKYVISFTWNGVFAIVAGGIVCYMLVTYVLSVGARVIQLAFLRIISPMAIMTFLSPKKDGMFSKWLKMCTTTYLDLFIRMAIIYFIVFMISTIMSSETGIALAKPFEDMWIVNIVMILALLIFGKKAPELLKELFPSSGGAASLGFGLKSPKKMFDSMLGGSILNKGYDKVTGLGKKAVKGVGLMPLTMGKKVITGIDYSKNGKGFWNGFTKNPGAIRTWVNKQRETFTPESYKASQERREGRENVNAINEKWNDGVSIAKTLMNNGFNNSTSATNSWTKALNGIDRNNYSLVFKHKEFADSKFAVDAASNEEERLRYAKDAVMSGGTVTINGVTYNSRNMDKLSELLDKSQKKLKGLEDVHSEISKQYQDDAKRERDFKFIKNNESNPANKNSDHRSNGI